MTIDNRTLAYAVVLVSFANSSLLIAMAKYRREPGLTVYAAGMTSFMFGFLLLLVQGAVGRRSVLVLGNLLIAFCYACLAWGMRLRNRLPIAWPRRFWLYFGLWALVFPFATFVRDSYVLRSCLMSAAVIAFCGEFIIGLRWRKEQIPLPIRRAGQTIAVLTGLMHAARGVLLLALSTPATKLLDDNVVSTFTLSISLVSVALWGGLILIIDAARLVVKLEANNEKLNELATTDALTGLGNRRSMDATVETELERARRYRQPLSLILFDLDNFKLVNDSWGHEVGDEVLAQVARIAKSLVREPDGVFRWGGEEFFVIAPNTFSGGAAAMAEKLRAAIVKEAHPRAGTITASFGVAEWSPEESKEAWLRRVDAALYQAKSDGRNRVTVSAPAGSPRTPRIKLEWRSEWESGNRIVDDGHRVLMDIANDLLACAEPGRADGMTTTLVERIFSETARHFAEEEAELEASAYADLAVHKRCHADLLKEAAEKREEFSAGRAEALAFFAFLVDKVIIGHLLTEDVLFYTHIRKTA